VGKPEDIYQLKNFGFDILTNIFFSDKKRLFKVYNG
jgi:hypothetical protein